MEFSQVLTQVLTLTLSLPFSLNRPLVFPLQLVTATVTASLELNKLHEQFVFHSRCLIAAKLNNYRTQTKFAEVMLLHVSVCPRGGGACVAGGTCVAGGIRSGGMHGMGACMGGGMRGDPTKMTYVLQNCF